MVLCKVFDKDGDAADKASLGLLCAVNVGGGKQKWIDPFVSHAEGYLGKRLRGLRKSTGVRIPLFSIKKLKPQIDAFATKLGENQPAHTAEAAKQMFDTLLQLLATTTEAASAAISELERQSDLRREETDVLCWLTAAVSRDLGVTFEELGTPTASLVAGKELADLISPPGALPARSLLQGIIPQKTGKMAGKPITLRVAVNATDKAWREGVVQKPGLDRIADLCPVLGALRESLTTDNADGWLGAYKKAYGINPKVILQPINLSHQMHRECLLAQMGD